MASRCVGQRTDRFYIAITYKPEMPMDQFTSVERLQRGVVRYDHTPSLQSNAHTCIVHCETQNAMRGGSQSLQYSPTNGCGQIFAWKPCTAHSMAKQYG